MFCFTNSIVFTLVFLLFLEFKRNLMSLKLFSFVLMQNLKLWKIKVLDFIRLGYNFICWALSIMHETLNSLLHTRDKGRRIRSSRSSSAISKLEAILGYMRLLSRNSNTGEKSSSHWEYTWYVFSSLSLYLTMHFLRLFYTPQG